MPKTTSDHIKPCNIGSSEAHNRRTPEYLSRINKNAVYVRLDLTDNNKSWISPAMTNLTLQDYYNQLAKMVKEKTGRAMQTKVREKVNKKTGKITKVNGSSPIRESVVVCNENTTIEDIKRYASLCNQRWGITPLQIFLHQDEGHYENPEDKSSWKPNIHAHIVWDWMNHETGKSHKLAAKDMSEMQDLLAYSLNMQRGKSKTETNREHLERNDFIVAKKKQELAELTSETEAKEKLSSNLDQEIADKEKAAKQDRKNLTNDILSGVAGIFGKGKYEETKKNEIRLIKQLEEKDRNHAQEINKLKAEHQQKELQLQNKHKMSLCKQEQTLSMLAIERDNANAKAKKLNCILNFFAEIIYKSDEIFRRAIHGIIDFATSCRIGCSHRDVLYNEEASAIKSSMEKLATDTISKKDTGWFMVNFAKEKGKLTEAEAHRCNLEVDSVAEGKYDYRIQKNMKEIMKI